MVNYIVEQHYSKADANRFLDVAYRSGRHDYLFRGDLASGAIIAAIVERAKEFAIKRSIEQKKSRRSRAGLLEGACKGISRERFVPAERHH